MNLLRLITFRQQAGPGFDPDAQAFITAAGITDSTQQSAINTLVLDLKSYGIWTKMKAAYPFVGGTATTHKYNLIDPRDLDAAFRLSFINSWTHTTDGAANNGSGHADTFLAPSAHLTNVTSQHISVYSNLNLGGQAALCMGAGGISTTEINLYVQFTNGNSIADVNTVLAQRASAGLGHILTNSTSTAIEIAVNGGITQGTVASGSLSTQTIFIGASNDNGPVFVTNRRFAFASIGSDLTATEISDFYTAVQAFQTTLGRQV